MANKLTRVSCRQKYHVCFSLWLSRDTCTKKSHWSQSVILVHLTTDWKECPFLEKKKKEKIRIMHMYTAYVTNLKYFTLTGNVERFMHRGVEVMQKEKRKYQKNIRNYMNKASTLMISCNRKRREYIINVFTWMQVITSTQ